MENNWSVQIEEEESIRIRELQFRQVPDFLQSSTNSNGEVVDGNANVTNTLGAILRNHRLRAMLFRFCSIMALQSGTDRQRESLRRILGAPNHNTGIQIGENGDSTSINDILSHCIYRPSTINAEQSPVLNNTGEQCGGGLMF